MDPAAPVAVPVTTYGSETILDGEITTVLEVIKEVREEGLKITEDDRKTRKKTENLI